MGVMLNTFLLSDRVGGRYSEVELSSIACSQKTGKRGRKQPGHSWADAFPFHPLGLKSLVGKLWSDRDDCWGGQEGGEEAGKQDPNIAVDSTGCAHGSLGRSFVAPP